MQLSRLFEDVIGDFCQADEPTECTNASCPRHSVTYTHGEVRQLVVFLDRRYKSMYLRLRRQRRQWRTQLRTYRRLSRSLLRFHNDLYSSHVAVPLMDSPEEMRVMLWTDDGYSTETEAE